jgi:hypothetical protein
VKHIPHFVLAGMLAVAVSACGMSTPAPTPTLRVILLPTVTPGQPSASNAQPAAPDQTPTSGQGRSGAFERPTSGTVQSVAGNTISVVAQDGTVTTATVDDNTTYSKASTIKASDLKEGDQVVVVGQKASDGSLTATQVTAGNMAAGGRAAGNGAFGGGQRQTFQGAAPGATPPAGGFGGGQRQSFQGRTPGATPPAGGTNAPTGGQFANMEFTNGTVQKVSDTSLTVMGQDGTTSTFAITQDTRLSEVTTASLSDVTVGSEVTIYGQAGSDGVIVATSVQIGPLGNVGA